MSFITRKLLVSPADFDWKKRMIYAIVKKRKTRSICVGIIACNSCNHARGNIIMFPLA